MNGGMLDTIVATLRRRQALGSLGFAMSDGQSVGIILSPQRADLVLVSVDVVETGPCVVPTSPAPSPHASHPPTPDRLVPLAPIDCRGSFLFLRQAFEGRL